MQYKNGLSYQIRQLFNHYPNLKMKQDNGVIIEVVGEILVSGRVKLFTVLKMYQVKLLIFKKLEQLPKVYEIGGEVEKTYAHISDSGLLCLETDTSVKLHFLNGFDLVEWLKRYVEPYFISYEFYQRYGRFPFGERPHGVIGIIDTYQQLFNNADLKSTLKIMLYIIRKSYRGHKECPCGSGLRIRDCHGENMKLFYENKAALEILKQDIEYIQKEVKSIAEN